MATHRLVAISLLAVTGWASGPAPATSAADEVLFANAGKVFYRLPGLLVTRQGTVLAAAQRRVGSSSDFAPSSWTVRRSIDGGKTFLPEQPLAEKPEGCVFNGNLVEDRRQGTLFACYIAFPQAQGSGWFEKTWIPRGGGFSVVQSHDDGKTWSAPRDVVPLPNARGWLGGGAFNNNHGIQIERGRYRGRLVIGSRVFKPGVYDGRAKAGLIFSDDAGKTWRVGGVVLESWGDIVGEVTVGETADGDIYVNCRNAVDKALKRAKQTGEPPQVPAGMVPQQRIFARSRDGGETFYAEGCHQDLFDPPCNAGQTRYTLADGTKVQLLTAPAEPGRTHLTLYRSFDSARTWLSGPVLSLDAGGYSDIAVLGDNRLLVLYESRQGLRLSQLDLTLLPR